MTTMTAIDRIEVSWDVPIVVGPNEGHGHCMEEKPKRLCVIGRLGLSVLSCIESLGPTYCTTVLVWAVVGANNIRLVRNGA
jgi:hypothetical protein